jgi:GGDEF domain-containing protein
VVTVTDVMSLRWLRSDPYYWVTAQLAVRGVESLTRRLFACTNIGLGLVPILLLCNDKLLINPWIRAGAAAVAGCCVLVGAQWLRHGWPSRAVSQVCAIVGPLCITAMALAVADPTVGLLIGATYGVTTAYVVLFHGWQLLSVVWLIAGTTLTVLATRLYTVNAALAVGGVFLLVAINAFIAISCRIIIGLIDADSVDSDRLDRLTGLPDRQGFHDAAAILLAARNRRDDRHFVIVVVSINELAGPTPRNEAAANQRRIAVGRRLRDTIRHKTLLAHPGGSEFFIADLFTEPDPTPLSARISHAIVSADLGVSVSIGVVSTPLSPLTSHSPYDVLDELLMIATTAMLEARGDEFHQTRHTINPALDILNDGDH